MVFINDTKYACESCIKGHRSSSCSHNDRPLFEIKKKGRPISQCEKCRELRKTRRFHSKCVCDERPAFLDGNPELSHGTQKKKSRRFVPIAPALPNGIKSVPSIPQPSSPINPMQKVQSLLNPCNCQDLWNCTCHKPDSAGCSSSNNSLVTLAQVASLAASSSCSENLSHCTNEDAVRKRDRDNTSRCSSPNTDSNPKKRRTEELHHQPPSSRGPDLPPLRFPHTDVTGSTTDSTMPSFPTEISIPSMQSVASIAGTGCTCGFTCACPGCIEHRVPQSSSNDTHVHKLGECGDGCNHCVDGSGDIELPLGIPPPRLTIAAEPFLVRAANLPLPPQNRFVKLDPTNVTVFPTDIFGTSSSLSNDTDARRAAWGLVEVPKLDCCGGFCGCPDDRCQCGTACGGCCAEGEEEKAEPDAPIAQDIETAVISDVVKGCCCGPS